MKQEVIRDETASNPQIQTKDEDEPHKKRRLIASADDLSTSANEKVYADLDAVPFAGDPATAASTPTEGEASVIQYTYYGPETGG